MSGQVTSLQGGLVAFEMTQIYEKITRNLNEAYESSLDSLQAYANQTKYVDQLQMDTDSLEEDSRDLLQSAQVEVGRI